MKTRDVFARAIEFDESADQAAFLQHACRDDPSQLDDVQSLLREHYRESRFSLDEPLLEATAAMPSPGPVVGDMIDKFKIREQLGEGGMGIVYVAEQREPVRRRVALKVIKPGMDSRDILARFGAEQQALALMDHPHIAKVFDAGVTDSGRPYFVMELVRGVPITEYCDENHLDTTARLRLFLDVCHAVQHAHHKGVIHRDIKPGNVLVTTLDGKPIAKVIDFGVAKAVNQQLTDQSIYTHFAQMVGTPLYMSPEQAEMNAVDVDTRTDVYSLGVLLYELLTGCLPFDRERLNSVAFDEMRRIIREEEPTKPSARLTTLGETAARVCTDRSADPRQLVQTLKGELDWIVMQALEKDRQRRYESASRLALDVENFLTGAPVVAAPPSPRYRLKKVVRRHKAAVTTASLILLALVLGIAGTTYGLIEAKQQQQIAEQAAGDAETARQSEAARAEGERLAKLEALEAVEAERRAKEEARQSAQAAKSATLQAEQRLFHVRKANEILGAVFDSLNPEAIALSGEPLQAVLATNLDAAIEQLDGEATGSALEVALLQQKLGASLTALGYPEKAAPVIVRSLEAIASALGNDHPTTLRCRSNLAVALQESGRPDEAVPVLEDVVQIASERFGATDPETIEAMQKLAGAYSYAGEMDRALPLLRDVCQERSEESGPTHPTTLLAQNRLANAYRVTGSVHRALQLHLEVSRLQQQQLGAKHPHTLASLSGLGAALTASGDPDQAITVLTTTLSHQREVLGSAHPATLTCMGLLAQAYVDAGHAKRGVGLLRDAITLCRDTYGADHHQPIGLSFQGGRMLEQAGATEAETVLQTVHDTCQKTKPDHWSTYWVMSTLGGAMLINGKHEAAEPLLLDGYRGLKEREAEVIHKDQQPLANALKRLIRYYETVNQPDDATRWRARLAEHEAQARTE